MNHLTQRQLTLQTGTAIDRDFAEAQADNSDEIKSIATRLALNEMKLNRWIGNEDDWQEIYKTVWLEKLLFVQTAFSVQQILENSKILLEGQKKMITQLGVIVTNTGQILQNQEIIITNQGIIIDVTGQIFETTQEILGQTTEILGTVNDIQGNVNDIKANGVIIRSNEYNGQTAKNTKTIWLVAGGLVAFLLLFIIIKTFRKKGK